MFASSDPIMNTLADTEASQDHGSNHETTEREREEDMFAESQPTHDQGNVVIVYHVTIVAIGHGLLKKFWPFWY